MRVLYIQSTSEIGGSDITLLRTVEHLDQSRFQPFVVFPKQGPLIPEFEAAGAQTMIVQMRKLTTRAGRAYHLAYGAQYLPTVWTLTRLIRRLDIDVVHTNTMHSLYGWLAARLAGRPHVWHVREIVESPRFVRAIELALVRHFSSRIVVMSEAIAAMFGPAPCRPPQLVKAYDGVDLQEFHPQISGARIRRELGITTGTPLVGIICRLDRWKGVDVLLRAAASVLELFPQARFLVAGGPIEGHDSYEAELRNLASQLGIAHAVIFAGWRFRHHEVPEVLAALDVVVHASKQPEPYGLAVIEAMAAGRALIATRIGGPVELAGGGVARLVPPNDPQSLAHEVSHLLANPDERLSLGNAARARAAAQFDVRKCVRQIEALYEQVVSPQTKQVVLAPSSVFQFVGVPAGTPTKDVPETA